MLHVFNGQKAIEAISDNKTAIDLVLMDIQMPEMDVYQATRAIRRLQGKQRHIPIIAMTAHAMKGDRERCLEAGMDDYIQKPIKRKTVFDVLEKWVLKTRPTEFQ